MYAIFGCASDFAYNFRHLMPTTLNCGATQYTANPLNPPYQGDFANFAKVGVIGKCLPISLIHYSFVFLEGGKDKLFEKSSSCIECPRCTAVSRAFGSRLNIHSHSSS